MTIFTRLPVALALAALSLYAALLSAELEDAFRAPEPGIRHPDAGQGGIETLRSRTEQGGINQPMGRATGSAQDVKPAVLPLGLSIHPTV